MQVQIHYVLQFLREARIVAQLECPHTVRLQTVGPPDPPHRGEAHLADLRQRAGAPVGSIGRSLAGGLAQDFVNLRLQDDSGSTRAGASLSTPANSCSTKRSCHRATVWRAI